MKITLQQLDMHLAKGLSALYVVSGDEILLKQDAKNQIREAAKRAGFVERQRISPEAGFDWDQLYQLLHATSLFSEKRFIELDFQASTPPKAAGLFLQEYLKNPSADNLLLLDLNKIDDKIAKSAWYKSLEKSATLIPVWPIPREQLPAWIMQRAKKYHLQFTHEAASVLTDYTEGNLLAAHQAIEKIQLLTPHTAIDAELIHTILTDESRFTIFDFVENLVGGNTARALHILENLKLDGTEPILILWAITRELRLLDTMATQLQQGLSYDELFQKHRIYAKRQHATRHFLKKYSATDCANQLSAAASIDRMIKGALSYNPWEALELFCLRLV